MLFRSGFESANLRFPLNFIFFMQRSEHKLEIFGLAEYFHGDFTKDINKNNPLGMKVCSNFLIVYSGNS